MMKMRADSAEDLVKGKDKTTIEEMIGWLKDTRNGTEFIETGASIANDGTFQSFIIDVKKNIIYLSNGKTAPVSLNGEYVKIELSKKR
jgi:hypothetical protein